MRVSKPISIYTEHNLKIFSAAFHFLRYVIYSMNMKLSPYLNNNIENDRRSDWLEVMNYTSLEQILQQETGKRSAKALILLNRLFENPFLQVKDVELFLQVSSKTANDLVPIFVKLNILEEISGQSRNRMFIFRQYIQLFS